MARQLPGSLVTTLRLLLGVVVLSGVAVVLTWIQRDQLVLTWAQDNVAAREILAERGLAALQDSPLVIEFVPLAIASFVVFALLVGVLAAFLVHGHAWARPSLTATLVFDAVVVVLVLGLRLPQLFVGLAAVSLVLHAALLVFLWRKDTTAYLRGA